MILMKLISKRQFLNKNNKKLKKNNNNYNNKILKIKN